MKHDQPGIRIPHLLLLALLGITAFPAMSVAQDDSQAERESRRLENEARRAQEQGRRDIEERERIQAEALRGQEEAIRRTEAAQARIEANSQRLFQQQEDQLRTYRQPSYSYIPPITPGIATAPSPPATTAVSPTAPEARVLPGNARQEDPVSEMTFAPLTDRLKSYFGAQSGVLVVSAGSLAPFGLMDGDVIISIDGRTPTDPAHAARILRSYQPGERVRLRVQRDQRTIELGPTAP